MTEMQQVISESRDRAPQAFDIEYIQAGERRYRLVYGVDEHAAQLHLLRSTWSGIAIISCKHIIERPRMKFGDWRPK